VVDAPRVALFFAPEPVARPLRTIVLQPAAIEERGPARRVTSVLVLTDDTALAELWPKMPPGARSLEVKAIRPDGSSQVLLWIRQLRPEWATSYVFPRDVVLPKGSVLQATAYVAPPAPAPPDPSFALTFTTYDVSAATTASASRPPASRRRR
jgi:hypothetical protein